MNDLILSKFTRGLVDEAEERERGEGRKRGKAK
jgi:hypothetical protein